jgi:flagellar motility protein MotE (MotC chaperone)
MNFSSKKQPINQLWKAILAAKIVILFILFALSGGDLRFGDLPLFAKGDEETKKTEKSAPTEPAAEAKAKGESEVKSEAKPRQSFLSNLLDLPELNPESIKKEELGRYLDIAERKKRQIEDRLSNLSRREEQLKGLEHSIDEKLKKLDEERRFFAETIQKEKDLKGERLDKLITLYAKMEPKKAAPVIEKLDKDLVVELFKQLPQKQVTAILEVMPADKSVSLSEYYGRVRSMREYDVLKEMNQSLRKEFDECKGMPKN